MTTMGPWKKSSEAGPFFFHDKMCCQGSGSTALVDLSAVQFYLLSDVDVLDTHRVVVEVRLSLL